MKVKPIILIIPSIDEKNNIKLSENYTNAISSYGAIPIISSYYNNICINHILNYIDGIIFSGGCDPNPVFFNENPLYCNDITPKRDIFEINICKKAFNKNIPILGICRGIQIIALSLGGSIYQDIQKQNNNTFKHYQNFSGKYPYHSVNINKKSILYSIIKSKKLYVNSFHHQSVKCVPKNFNICALSDDLVIEAMEYNGNNFVLGLQWHPEQMYKKSLNKYIFKYFIYKSKIYHINTKGEIKNGFQNWRYNSNEKKSPLWK